MLIVVSPAKSLNLDPVEQNNITKPRFMKETKTLVGVMKDKSEKELKKLMSISDKLATLNLQRYQSFKFPMNKENSNS